MVMFEGKVEVSQTVSLTITNLDIDSIRVMLKGLSYLENVLPDNRLPEDAAYLRDVLLQINREAVASNRFYFSGESDSDSDYEDFI